MTDNRTTEQTTTERLRALLDERGVEYDELMKGNTTLFRFDYCKQCDDYLHTIAITGACISAYLDYLEPKQAIAATLGRGKCKIQFEFESESYLWRRCTNCNHLFTESKDWEAVSLFKFCPECGCEVVG